MNRVVPYIISHIGAFVVGAGIFGFVGVFVGYELAQSGTPAVLVANLTDVEITQIVVHTDRGDSHSLAALSPRASHRVKLLGGDQHVWITVSTPEGKSLESKQVYTTAGGLVFGAICGEAITLVSTLM